MAVELGCGATVVTAGFGRDTTAAAEPLPLERLRSIAMTPFVPPDRRTKTHTPMKNTMKSTGMTPPSQSPSSSSDEGLRLGAGVGVGVLQANTAGLRQRRSLELLQRIWKRDEDSHPLVND